MATAEWYGFPIQTARKTEKSKKKNNPVLDSVGKRAAPPFGTGHRSRLTVDTGREPSTYTEKNSDFGGPPRVARVLACGSGISTEIGVEIRAVRTEHEEGAVVPNRVLFLWLLQIIPALGEEFCIAPISQCSQRRIPRYSRNSQSFLRVPLYSTNFSYCYRKCILLVQLYRIVL